MKIALFFTLFLLLSVTAHPQIRLVKDINDHSVSAYALTRQPVIINNELLLVIDDGVHGEELWKSDGTADGTIMLKDIVLSFSSSFPKELTAVNDVLFFTAWDGINTGRELWKSDGTPAGTIMVKDFLSGDQNDGPIQLTELNGILYFLARNDKLDKPGRELWRSDGSPQGTYVVKETAIVWNGPDGLIKANGKLFFTGYTAENGRELWVSDGTEAGTHEIKNISPETNTSSTFNLSEFKPYAGGIFFVADDGVHGAEIWKSDGTAEGTVMLQDFFPGDNTFGVSLSDAVTIGNKIFYRIGDYEIWCSSALDNTTTLLKSMTDPDVYPQNFSRYGDKLLFSARNNINQGESLWISDGTLAGTVKVKEINSTAPADITQVHEVNGKIYFSAKDETTGNEPWVTDGTPDGTHRMFDLVTGPGSSYPTDFIFYKEELFFSAANETFGEELFHEDGTIVKDIQVRTISTIPWPSFEFQDNLFFYDYYSLWKTDGTEAGTAKVIDYLNVDRSTFVPLNGKAFFIGGNLAWERSIFVTDGTTEGTQLFFDLGHDYSLPVLHQSFMFFCNGTNLYKTDGTPGGTQLVKILPADPQVLISSGDFIYFVANDLWRSDGTEAGTQLVKDIPDAVPSQLTASNGLIYFSIEHVGGADLWRSDGTEAGTQLISSFGDWSNLGMVDVNGMLFFSAGHLMDGKVLWKTDGTAVGTVVVKDLRENDVGFRPWLMKNVNGTLFFSANGFGNDELWKSDGTAEGTVMVKRWEGNHGIGEMQSINNELFFTSSTAAQGYGIGRSDGTAAGTQIYYPHEPGGVITSLLPVGDKLYFTFDSFRYGIELYVLETSPDILCRDFSVWSLEGKDKTCVGHPVELSATVETLNTALTYTWLRDGNVITDQSQSSLMLLTPALADQGKYEVIVSNGECSASANAIELKVKDVPVITDPGVLEIETGNSVNVRLHSIPQAYTEGYKVLNVEIPGGASADENNAGINPDLTVGADHLYYDRYNNTLNDAVEIEYTIVPVSLMGCTGDELTLRVRVLPDEDNPDIITGNESPLNAESISVYPNPVHREIRIGFKKPVQQTVRVVIYSGSGQVAYSADLAVHDQVTQPIDTRNWLPGIYYVIIRDSNKQIMSSKILKLK